MFSIAGQTTGPNGLKFVKDTHRLNNLIDKLLVSLLTLIANEIVPCDSCVDRVLFEALIVHGIVAVWIAS